VVLIHSTDWIQETSIRIPGWVDLNEVLSTLRMPLFFVCSGILARKWITAGWGDLVSRRVVFLAWVYLVWQPIGSLMALVAAQFTGDELTFLRMIGSLALTPFRPRFELWFLWALALFLVLARASARIPRLPQIAVAAGLSALWLSDRIPETNLGWDGAIKYYVFFLIGCHYRSVLEDFADRLGFESSLVLIGSWFLLSAGVHVSGLDDIVGVGLLVRVIGVAAGIALALRLQSLKAFSYPGTRTLPIYLAHTPLIIGFTWLLSRTVENGLPTAVIVGLPVLFSLVAVLLSLGLHGMLNGNPVGGLLYTHPVLLVGWVQRLFADRGRPRVIDLRAVEGTPAVPAVPALPAVPGSPGVPAVPSGPPVPYAPSGGSGVGV
jgi:uncharacterized membrane protein YcfT